MAGLLKTQKDIERAREQAAEFGRKAKQLKREIRESSGRLAALAERLCGRTVLHLLRQGTPPSSKAIITQARAIAGTRDQEALALLIELLETMPPQTDRNGRPTLDPRARFDLGESLRHTPRVEPVDYVTASLGSIRRGEDFAAESADVHQTLLLSLIDAEGPICRELIYTRIRQVWNLPQAHPAVKRIIGVHIEDLRSSGRIDGDADSFWMVGRDVIPRRRSKRFRENHNSETVPAIELRAAIIQYLRRTEGTMAEIVAGSCGMIGYESVSHALRTRIQDEIFADLCSRGDVVVVRD